MKSPSSPAKVEEPSSPPPYVPKRQEETPPPYVPKRQEEAPPTTESSAPPQEE